MNLLSKFLPRTSPTSIVTLAPGEVYILRNEKTPKGRRECIFPEAELTLAKTSQEFCYELVLHRVNDDTVETDSLDGIESDERTFLVDEAIQIGYYGSKERPIISWLDLSGDEGDRYEFVCESSISLESLDTFYDMASVAQYERKYQRSPPKNADFKEFEFDYAMGRDSNSEEGENQREHSLSVAGGVANEHIVSNVSGKNLTRKPYSEGRVIASEKATLCLFDSTKEVFVPQFEDVTAVVLDQDNYDYWLEFRKDSYACLGTPILDELNPYSHPGQRALIFNYVAEEGLLLSYLAQFNSVESLNNFENGVAIAEWERMNRRRWQDLGDADQDYVTTAMNNATIDDNGDSGSEEESSDVSGEDLDEDQAQSAIAFSQPIEGKTTLNMRNSALEVGHTNDRTYVVRGNRIGVFKHDDQSLQYQTTIDNVRTFGGEELDPARVMLHERDRALILQGNEKDRLYRMDLEYGKVVDEWQMGNHNVKDFAPVSKFAQTTSEQSLYGVSDQSMFQIDPRLSGAKVVGDTQKLYKTKMGLSVLATTESGYMVVGSDKGDIRLYDKLGRVAKTHIPGLGRGFIGIDVTADGRFVLATCKDYLLLVETVTEKHNGFAKSWAKDSKPRPIMLKISPQNASYMRMQTGSPISFTAARFNTGPSVKEEAIITSTGPYLVIWNIRRVLRGESDAYLVKRYDSDVTAENFKFGTDKRMIVALENDVSMVSKASLRRPNKESL